MKFLLLTFTLILSSCNWQNESTRLELKPIVNHLKTKLTGDFHKDIDLVRKFIYNNSEHRSTENFVLSPVDIKSMSSEVWKAFIQPKHKKPNLYCGHRANLMIAVLKELGFKTRHVNIISDNYSSLMGHIFPEVLNPKTKLWEINDPDYNVYYINQQNTRIGVMELIFDNTNNILPCTDKECSIQPEGRADVKVLMENFFEGAWIGTDIYINNKKFDVKKRFSDKGNKTLFEYLSTHEEKYTFHYQKQTSSSKL